MRRQRPPRNERREERKERAIRIAREKRPPPPKVERRTFPPLVVDPPAPVRTGEWLMTTRPAAEQDLVEELFYTDAKTRPRVAGPSLVAADRLPKVHGEVRPPAFARQGFPVAAFVNADGTSLAEAARSALAQVTKYQKPWALDVWVPDSEGGNPQAQRAAELGAEARARANPSAADAREAFAENGLYAQACLLPDGRLAVGATWARDALSLASGGRLRVHVPEHAPSRSAMKLVEAFTWLDREPEPGDRCCDLGAAPGGWSWALLERRAHVVAVDLGALDKSLAGKKGLEHIRVDGFKYEASAEEPYDWLFCDMAFRPLEVAGLLAKWARRRWARQLVANIKLPMKQKAQTLLRVRDILEDGGWDSLRVRQLYHDRDEVTVGAVRLR
jgi:23S rRNA (cytidine2498-2'-O)-methyltransferase